MSQILEGYWNELKGEAQKSWGKLTHNELDQVAGDTKKLEGLLQQKYGHSVEEARKEVDKLQARYDNMASAGEWNQLKGKMQKYWGEITENDADKINGSRTRLVGLLQERLGKSRSEALAEVDHFLKQIS
ncbi:CsbD family protein [Allomuricauda sp. d1]|uniref:CsbD family protein n=1 Tax=Allomuricauda sp. d1 TaxID=3136725 RepID=UPI0031DA074B